MPSSVTGISTCTTIRWDTSNIAFQRHSFAHSSRECEFRPGYLSRAYLRWARLRRHSTPSTPSPPQTPSPRPPPSISPNAAVSPPHPPPNDQRGGQRCRCSKMCRLKRHRHTDSSGGNRIKQYNRFNIQKLVRRSDKKTAKLFDIDEAIQLVTNCPIQ